jgi:8-oxo-dGTP pyrophosphatase MutT (NUDIX family)
MPAGSQELNESILDCLIREVKEETGLDVFRATPMAIYSNISIVTSFQDPYHLFLVQFLVDRWSGELELETDETVDARFFSLDALPEDLVDYYYEVIEDLRNYDGELIVK